jgi:hypothetical protein
MSASLDLTFKLSVITDIAGLGTLILYRWISILLVWDAAAIFATNPHFWRQGMQALRQLPT